MDIADGNGMGGHGPDGDRQPGLTCDCSALILRPLFFPVHQSMNARTAAGSAMPHAMIKVITKGSSTILSSSKGYSGDELAEDLCVKHKVGNLPQRVGNNHPLPLIEA